MKPPVDFVHRQVLFRSTCLALNRVYQVRAGGAFCAGKDGWRVIDKPVSNQDGARTTSQGRETANYAPAPATCEDPHRYPLLTQEEERELWLEDHQRQAAPRPGSA